MERIVLKWSCNRRKFEDIVVNGLTEILGHVNNTTWELTICTENRRISTKENQYIVAYCPLPFWKFVLHRSIIDEELKATAKVIANDKVWSKDVHFDPYQKSSIIFESLKIDGLVDYRLVFCLILENNVKADEVFKEEFQVVKLQHLSSCLHIMYEKEHMTDVVLKCGSVALKAHKNIISCQSPVFAAMFTSPMLEREQDTVVIKDMDPSAFRAMITFMYSGRVKVESESIIYDLLYASEKYQIESLKEGCIEYLESILSIDNAIKILEVSNLFDKQLKLHCLSFIHNNFEELKSTKDWKDLKLKNPVLALEVYTIGEGD